MAEKQLTNEEVIYNNQVLLKQQLDEQISINQNNAEELAKLKQANQKRTLPASELDLNLMLTDTMWGNPNISPLIKDKLTKSFVVTDANGNKMVSKEDLWGMLGFYTRDMRLGNLSEFGGELHYCEYHTDLANDFLKEGFVEPFLICLSRVATKLELSQSKKGFLRRRNSSFTTESIQGSMDPPKRSLMGNKVPNE